MAGLGRLSGWLALAAPVVAGAAVAGPQEDRPPNVVVILADDLGYGDVGFHGRREWATPNLDRLAAEGTVLDRFYTAAVVCAPSRAALMTGKAPWNCGVRRNNDDLPAAEVTIAEALKARGYATGGFGKWHHGQPPAGQKVATHPIDQGFDRWFGFLDARHAWEKHPTELWQDRELLPSEGYVDDLFTDRAIAFVEAHRERPFFLYVPYTATHFHLDAPPEEFEAQKSRFPDDPAAAHYAGMVVRLDKNVGRLLAAIDGQGLADETMVVFLSDHGATFESGNQGASRRLDSNRPFRGQKRTLWEGGLRVPAIVRWPGRVPAGVVSETPYHTTDLLPTLLAAAGGAVDPAWKVDGRDVLAAWKGGEPVPERSLAWEWRSEGANLRAILRGRLKLVIAGGTPPELYDVVADPAERLNVAAEHPELVRDLRRELDERTPTEPPAR